ncbi:MAG: MgPME-cyclase complex family protein [Cyanobacteriota bacterium]
MSAAEPATYHFVAASLSFLRSEPLEEVLEERRRYYEEHNRPIDFFWVPQPAFLETPALESVRAKLNGPVGAVISTDADFIRWLSLRLTFVETGTFVAPSESIPDPLHSLAPAEG